MFIGMEKFDIQVLLKDGSFADFQVENETGSDIYQVFQKDKSLAQFVATEDGGWIVGHNSGNLDDDLQQRIINQLNGFKA